MVMARVKGSGRTTALPRRGRQVPGRVRMGPARAGQAPTSVARQRG
jgi:hypothetical protein